MSFSYEMAIADRYLEEGDLDKALQTFSKAWLSAENADEQSKVKRRRGQALRGANRLSEAETSLREALELTSDTIDKALIKADIGMVYLKQAIRRGNDMLRLQSASRLFQESFKALTQDRRPIEASRSYALYGRVIFLQGNRHEAVRIFRSAHETLYREDPAIELNNLIWLARASSLGTRIRYIGRVRYLCLETGHWSRWKEYLVILVGGDFLYRFLKKRVRA